MKKQGGTYRIQFEPAGAAMEKSMCEFMNSLGWTAATGAADFCFIRRREAFAAGPQCALGPAGYMTFANKMLLYDVYVRPFPAMRKFMPTQYSARWVAGGFRCVFAAPSGSMWMIKGVQGRVGSDIYMVRHSEIAATLKRLSAAARPGRRESKDFGYVISRYITNPLLLDGRKFHLRVYFIVAIAAGVARGFIRRECLIFATRGKYAPDSPDAMMHNVHALTGAEVMFDGGGVFAAAFGAAAAARLFDDLRVLFGHITRVYGAAKAKARGGAAKWSLFGADIMLTPEFVPQLLEINMMPSLKIFAAAAAARLSFARDIYEMSVAPFYPPPPGYVMVRNFIEV